MSCFPSTLSRYATRFLPALLMPLLMASSGCSLFSSSKGKQLPGQVEDGTVERKIVVIIRKDKGKSRHELPWEEGLFLQDVIERTGVKKRFNNMLVEIKRPTESNYQTIPMPAKYDFVRQRVTSETNYAIHPGDFVIVTDDSKTAVDRLIESVSNILF